MKLYLHAKVCLFAILFFAILATKAQTTLSAGEVVITGFTTDDPDHFTFVLLKDIDSGTQLHFTDNGWNTSTGAFRPGEGTLTWTATSNLSAGTVVDILDLANPFSANIGTITDDNTFLLSATGDQILVYQGSVAAPSFINAINMDSSGWSNAIDPQSSALPPGLTDGTNAINFGEIDNGSFICPSDPLYGYPTTLLAAIVDISKWELVNGPFVITTILGGNCSFNVIPDTDGDGIYDDVDVDDDNDGILDVIECTDLGKTPLLNSDFEDVDIVTSGLDGGPTDTAAAYSGIWKGDASNIPNWESADPVNNDLEIWQNGHTTIAGIGDIGGIAYSGTQWSEINASSNDGMYQDIATVPGDMMEWSFAHRKRTQYAGSATEDEMQLLIGDPGGTMVSQGNFSSAGDASWTVHSGTYTVPVGQTTTRLTFAAINTASGSLQVGNFVDKVELFVLPNCENTDADSLENFIDLDSDNDGIPDNVEAQSTGGYILPSGTVNIAGAYIGLWDNYGTGITPEDTDNDGSPDYLDSDSDNDGYQDIQENGMASGLLGTDTDSDGLDDNFEGGNLDDPLDVNDEIDNPSSSILPDSDFDLGTGGDLDYRDANPPICTIGSDSDGDGINDVCDLDDDNDGIPDVNELGTIVSTEQQPCGGDTPLDFSGTQTLLSGTDLQQGAVYRFSSITADMDAIVTIVETNNATVVELDRNATTPSSFKPRTGFNFTNSGEFGYIEYLIQFVNTGGFTPQTIEKFFMNFNDLDGGSNFGEQNWADNPKTFTIDNPTELTWNTDGSWIVATGATSDYGPSTNEFPYINFAVNYTNKSEISIRVGAIARVPGVSSSGRSHSIEFNCVTNYVSPQTYSLDADYDGLANHLDLDSDNDGILDAVESGHGQTHTNGIVNGPYGANGLSDLVETSPGSNSINNVLTDTDGVDGPNYLDIDSDGDDCYDALEGSAGYDYTDVDIYSGQLLAATDANGIPGGTSQGVGTSVNSGVQSIVCNLGATVDFDGIDDHLAETAFMSGWPDATLMAWVKLDPTFATDGDVAGQGIMRMYVDGTTRVLRSYLRTSAGGANGSSSLTALDLDTWYHVALTYNGSTGDSKIYINGVMERITGIPAGTLSTDPIYADPDFNIGRHSRLNNSFFKGAIDEVRVFDMALTDDQIQGMVYQEIENNGGVLKGSTINKDIKDISTSATVPWSNLQAYYPMSNILTGKTVDASDYTRDAELKNILTVQPQTAPMPYETVADGPWTTEGTWLHGDVWDINDVANNKDWSIVSIKNNVSTSDSHSQFGLMIDAGSSLTVTGDNFISNNWYLELNGTLDLAGDSQLIQTENSDLVTSATGQILRRQEGNADMYWYNYWASPVGSLGATSLIDNNGTGNNTNNSAFNLAMIKDGAGTPMQFTSAFDEVGKISDRWLYSFQNGQTYYDWVVLSPASAIAPGVGYTQKGTGNAGTEQQYIFDGKPNNGTILVAADDVDGDSGNESEQDVTLTTTLVGNPYPSALDADEFIRDNTDFVNGGLNPTIQGTILLWEQWAGSSHWLAEYEGGYGFINLTSTARAYQHPDIPIADQVQTQGIKTPTKFIPVGQGFFVEVVNDGNIEFNNSQRVFKDENAGESVFFRGAPSQDNTADEAAEANPMQTIKLEFGVSNGATRRFVLGFSGQTTDGFDPGYDGGLITQTPDEDMTTLMQDKAFVIQAFSPITEDSTLR